MIVMAKNKSDQKRRIENVLSALKHDKLAIASLVFLVIIIALALLAPILPLDPNTTDVRNMFQPPSPEHWFGTDDIGRDYLSRVIYGGRVSLLVGFLAMITCVCVGVLVGTVSGYCGGWIDSILMRIVDIIYSVPEILLIVVIKMVISEPLQNLIDTVPAFHGLQKIGSGLIAIFIVYGCLYWVGMARIVRGQILQLKTLDFVTAAEALGCGRATMIREHLLPNCIGQLIATVMLQIPSAIFTEAFLSYLGIGVSAPMASLGSLTSEALNGISSYPYRVVFPAVLISLIILSFNLFGDGLRDALDPKMKK